MRPKDPLREPLQMTQVGGEVVFIGEGGVNFSMTLAAACATLERLALTLQASPAPVVLLVEDEPTIRRLGAEVLREAGYGVIQAECAADALAALECGSPVQLLFTDIQLPGGVDGLELARQVRERWPAVRLLLCSGRARPGLAQLPQDVPFLPKPYIAAEMLRRVDELTAL